MELAGLTNTMVRLQRAAKKAKEAQRIKEGAEKAKETQLQRIKKEVEKAKEAQRIKKEAEKAKEAQHIKEEPEKAKEAQHNNEEAEKEEEAQHIKEEAEKAKEAQHIKEEAEKAKEAQRIKEEVEKAKEAQRIKEEAEKAKEAQHIKGEAKKAKEAQHIKEEVKKAKESQHIKEEAEKKRAEEENLKLDVVEKKLKSDEDSKDEEGKPSTVSKQVIHDVGVTDSGEVINTNTKQGESKLQSVGNKSEEPTPQPPQPPTKSQSPPIPMQRPRGRGKYGHVGSKRPRMKDAVIQTQTYDPPQKDYTLDFKALKEDLMEIQSELGNFKMKFQTSDVMSKELMAFQKETLIDVKNMQEDLIKLDDLTETGHVTNENMKAVIEMLQNIHKTLDMLKIISEVGHETNQEVKEVRNDIRMAQEEIEVVKKRHNDNTEAQVESHGKTMRELKNMSEELEKLRKKYVDGQEELSSKIRSLKVQGAGGKSGGGGQGGGGSGGMFESIMAASHKKLLDENKLLRQQVASQSDMHHDLRHMRDVLYNTRRELLEIQEGGYRIDEDPPNINMSERGQPKKHTKKLKAPGAPVVTPSKGPHFMSGATFDDIGVNARHKNLIHENKFLREQMEKMNRTQTNMRDEVRTMKNSLQTMQPRLRELESWNGRRTQGNTYTQMEYTTPYVMVQPSNAYHPYIPERKKSKIDRVMLRPKANLRTGALSPRSWGTPSRMDDHLPSRSKSQQSYTEKLSRRRQMRK